MNTYRKRIIAAVAVGIAIVTAIYIPIKKDVVVHVAYGSLLLAAVLSGVSLWQLSKTIGRDYMTSVAFPLALKSYILATVLMAVLFVALDLAEVWSVPFAWYLALQVIVIALTEWKLLAIGAAQEAICNTGEKVQAAVSRWKLYQADMDAILQNAPNDMRRDITAVRDAIRYADPMSRPEVNAQEEQIAEGIAQLQTLVTENKADDVSTLCANLQNIIRDRANRLKFLK